MLDHLLSAATEHEREEGELSGFMLVTFHHGQLSITAACIPEDIEADEMISAMAEAIGCDSSQRTMLNS
jgi:hypothetical protein